MLSVSHSHLITVHWNIILSLPLEKQSTEYTNIGENLKNQKQKI